MTSVSETHDEAARPLRREARRRPSFFEHLHPATIPDREARFGYTFGLGGISLFLVLILTISGALELFYYEPNLEGANASVQRITHLVPYGWLVRGVHYWAGQALIVTVALHLVRVLLTGAYHKPRRLNWLLGICLLAAVLLLNFTGLVLRWDNDIAWALMVGTNLLRTIPLVGDGLYLAAVGGGEISGATVVRFFGWHIFGLALPASVVLVWHLFRIRRDGGISHQLESSQPGKPRLPRSDLVRRETIAALLAGAVLLALTVLFPPGVSPRPDFDQLPAEASAPWFFLWVQQLLRLGDALLMGVVIPASLLAVVALAPLVLDRDPAGVGTWFNRQGRTAQWTVLTCIAVVLALIVKGALS